MEKRQILRRLQMTIRNLQKLSEDQFNYEAFVTEAKQRKNGTLCGTICCVAGHYPNWYGNKSELKYIIEISNREGEDIIFELSTLEDDPFSVTNSLVKFHGINGYLISALFYGANESFEYNPKSKQSIYDLQANYQSNFIDIKDVDTDGDMQIGLTKSLESNLEDVTAMFQLVYDLIKDDVILNYKSI